MNHRLFYNTEHLIEMYMDTDKEVQRIKQQQKSDINLLSKVAIAIVLS